MTIYEGAAQDAIKALKFGRALAAGRDIGVQMAKMYGSSIRPDVLIVPVPTARRRVRRRGYDQAAVIARAFADHSSGRYAPLLIRHGSQEQKGAGLQQRREQLHGAYEIKHPERVQGQRIVLIDDVLTTGSTLEAAAVTLRMAGARTVGALVFARA